MAWNPESKHWIVERQSGSGCFVIWPTDPSRSLEDQGLNRDSVVLTDLRWREAVTYSNQWNALRDFLGPTHTNPLGASGLVEFYEKGVAGGHFAAVEPTVDSPQE
jgi:hypothetical protein